MDFEHERREEVIQYIYERYGRKRAAMLCNVICFKSKGALRFTGKALGIPEPIFKKASKLLESRTFRTSPARETLFIIKKEVAPTSNSPYATAYLKRH